jgi:hypothetical protein
MVNLFSRKIRNGDSGNSHLVVLLFVFTIIFQLTSLKFIWGIEPLSRILNSMALVILFVLVGFTLNKSYSRLVWNQYLIPGMMISFGIILNIVISCFSDISNVNLLGTAFPWLLYLIIPYYFYKNKIDPMSMWKWYYYFLTIFMLLGLVDYFYFSQLSGLKILITPFGNYLGGKFSWLYMNEDLTPHLRYYGCFYEPGTLAMFLLPAISYAFFKRYYFGLMPLLVAFYLTLSLGGFISLILLVLIFTYKSIAKSKKTLIISILSIVLLSSIIYSYTANLIKEEYNDKGNSATVREESVSKMFEDLPTMIFRYPLGIPYSSKTSELEKVKIFSGTNFLLGTYLQFGGIISLVGIILVLFVSMKITIKKITSINLSVDEKIIYSSLIVLFPFIFQRTTIWDSALFGLMFAPSIIASLVDSDK